MRGLLGVSALLVLAAAPSWAREADGADRLLDRFVEDGAVVPGGWLEGRVQFQWHDAGDRYALGSFIAFNVAEDFEFGFAFDGLLVDPDSGSSEGGLSDLTAYGKARLMEIPVVLSVGVLATFPTGDEDKGLGTGEVGLEVFAALRRSYEKVTWIAHAGLRLNQDIDRAVENGFFLVPGGAEAEGKVSFLGGVGALFLLDERWSFQTELSLETRRYSGLDSDVRLTPGFAYRTDRATYRGGISLGLSDGAPDVALVGGAVLRF